MRLTLCLAFAAAVMAFVLVSPARSGARRDAVASPDELRRSATSALALVQHSQDRWSNVQTCTSCHHQLIPQIPFQLARERGIAVDRLAARRGASTAFARLRDADASLQRADFIDVFFDAWMLVGADAAGVAPSLSTDAYAVSIASRQREDGSWISMDNRPPQSYGPFQATAVCARAIGRYMPGGLANERDERRRRALAWLVAAKPASTDDSAFRLFGLAWTGADAATLADAAQALVAEQRADGGWAELAGYPTDAYSTGEALSALSESGVLATTDPVYQRGLRFLLRTQRPDGSWRVTSRLNPPAPVSPPYVDTAYPGGHDQFVSLMGACWAATAMMDALPRSGGPAERGVDDVAPAGVPSWARTVLGGSVADLAALLDGGLDPNARTAGGSSVLMFAARDPKKVELLLARGAAVDAPATSGVTPLMVAARYGNADSVRMLLAKGARPNRAEGAEVENDASPLFFAVMSNDSDTISALLASGARVNEKMKVLGFLPMTALYYAVSAGYPEAVARLLDKGGDVNEVDGDAMSLVHWAAIANRAPLVELLVKHGADPNRVDSRGMTPLMYAASTDFGDTATIRALVAAGADPTGRNPKGRTAADLARGFHLAALAAAVADDPRAKR